MATTVHREITRCRMCGSSQFDEVFSLGDQSLTGVFPKSRTDKVTIGPLTLVKCSEQGAKPGCGLLQLKHSFNPDEMYRGDYGYRSGLNLTMTQHLQHVATTIADLVTLKAGDIVLDIGSNDATLLKSYPNAGLSLIGIDPSAVNFKQYYPDNVALVTDFFTAAAYRGAMGNRQAKVVTSIAMFYDLESPLVFVEDIKSILADDGVWVFEQSYMPLMIERNAYDTVCHEHLEYYGLRQIKWLTDRVGFKILDVEINDVNGGSFRITVAHEKSNYRPTDRWQALLQKEERDGMNTLKPYTAFKDTVFHHRDELNQVIRDIHKRGETILGYGASTKGNVVLQFCGLTEKDIPAIAERNPEKYGRFTPGTLIPIISEQQARERHPNYFLALPWHFRPEFIKREAAFVKAGGKAILFPLPKVDVVGA